MKNLISRLSVLILATSFLPSISFATGFDTTAKTEIFLETLRTETAPGFFRATLIPSEDLRPLKMREVYIKNYSPEEAFLYEPLLVLIKENLNGQFASAEAVDLLLGNPHNRITFLGEKDSKKRPNVKHFQVQDPETKLEEFEAFHTKELPPVYGYNLNLQWDETNVSDVYPHPDNHPLYLTEDGLTFVGKFEESKPTFLSVLGATNNGVLEAQALLALDDSGFIDSFESFNLPQTWEEYSMDKKPNQPKPRPHGTKAPNDDLVWLKALLLIGLVGFVIYVIKEFYGYSECEECELNGLVFDESKGFIDQKAPANHTMVRRSKPQEKKTKTTVVKKQTTTTTIKETPEKKTKTITMKMEMKTDDPIDDLPFSVEKKNK